MYIFSYSYNDNGLQITCNRKQKYFYSNLQPKLIDFLNINSMSIPPSFNKENLFSIFL